MGSELPDDIVLLDPAKWYCVLQEHYDSGTPGSGCVGQFATPNLCVFGATIIEWIAKDGQCSGEGLVFVPFRNNQRIINIVGPFDTHAECVATGCGATQ